jgi:hypothetical protein
MAEVVAVLPQWATMASFADGKTLWHVNLAMVALFDLDEYQTADAPERRLMEWTVLLHDIAKEPTEERRDHLHAFRSAAVVAGILPDLGFAITSFYEAGLDAWQQLVFASHRFDEAAGEPIADNTNLAEILAGADRLLAMDAARVVKAIALHQSVTVLAEWPSLAPLDAAQATAFITAEVAALQLPLMLADSGGWNLFDPSTLADMYSETRAVFAGIAARRG